MKTKNLDVVYFVSAYPQSDLLYSLRSVAKNLECNKVWIYGGKRTCICPDRYCRVMNQVGGDKWEKVRNMYRLVCNNDDITEDFIMFHDDFFVMKPMNSIEPLYRGTFEQHINDVEAKFGKNLSRYTSLLKHASETLKNANKGTLSYELHTPFVFNRKKLLKILEMYPNEHCIRSIYANYYKIGGKQHYDIKIFDMKPAFDYKKEPLLSTDDTITTAGNEHWDYIREQFPERCRFEQFR